eukprot:gene11049-35248_t
MSDTPPALPPASERDWLTFEEVAEKDSEFRAAANAAPKPAPEAEAAALKCLTSEIEPLGIKERMDGGIAAACYGLRTLLTTLLPSPTDGGGGSKD